MFDEFRQACTKYPSPQHPSGWSTIYYQWCKVLHMQIPMQLHGIDHHLSSMQQCLCIHWQAPYRIRDIREQFLGACNQKSNIRKEVKHLILHKHKDKLRLQPSSSWKESSCPDKYKTQKSKLVDHRSNPLEASWELDDAGVTRGTHTRTPFPI